MIKLANLLKECGNCERDWNGGHDHEASMAKNELRDLVSNASKVDNLVQDQDNLPGWVSAYITLAADYMHSVAEYLGGEAAQMGASREPTPGYAMYEGAGALDSDKAQEIQAAIAAKYPDVYKYNATQLRDFLRDRRSIGKIRKGDDPAVVFKAYSDSKVMKEANKGGENIDKEGLFNVTFRIKGEAKTYNNVKFTHKRVFTTQSGGTVIIPDDVNFQVKKVQK